MAEANRPPFDLPEAEGELVAGYHVEYSSLTFAFFYISEYATLLFNSMLLTTIFCSGPTLSIHFASFSYEITWSFWLSAAFFFLVQIGMRAAFPRYVIDFVMDIGWKYALVINLFFILCLILLTWLTQ